MFGQRNHAVRAGGRVIMSNFRREGHGIMTVLSGSGSEWDINLYCNISQERHRYA